MENEIEKLKSAILFLTDIVALSEARSNLDSMDKSLYRPDQFRQTVEMITRQVEDILK